MWYTLGQTIAVSEQIVGPHCLVDSSTECTEDKFPPMLALARRIGVVLHRMWRDGTEFRFTREAAMALQTA